MKKTTVLYGLVALAVIIAGLIVWQISRPAPTAKLPTSYKDATYVIDDRSVTLTSGVSVMDDPSLGSAAQTTTTYFGDEATGDLNGDGTADVAFILTQDGGGSGTFFYIVAARAVDGGYAGSNGVLLGDRIAPQGVEIHGGLITVNYADRGTGEPMSAAPTVGVTRYFKLVNGKLAEAFLNGN